MRQRYTEQTLNEKIQKLNQDLKLVPGTFKSVKHKAWFIDGKYPDKPFQRVPADIWDKGCCYHPEQSKYLSGAIKAGVTLEEYTVKKTKQTKKTMLEKYGVESLLALSEFQNKAQAGINYTARYENIKNTATQQGVKNLGWNEKAVSTRKKNKTLGSSHAERSLLQGIQRFCPEAKGGHFVQGRSVDIFIESLNLAIDYNGLYWHSENKNPGSTRHLRKMQHCASHGVELIQIWENEWIKAPEKVLNYIKARAGVFSQRTPARRTKVQELTREEAIRYLKEWHLQGAPNKGTKIFLALITEQKEVVSIITAGPHHRTARGWVLSRFASKPGQQVLGALGKLTKALSILVRETIITWADLRLTTGKAYEKAGWVHDGDTKPDYFYFKGKGKTQKVLSKQSRRKSACATPEGMTEAEHAKIEGLGKVWDCGKRRFVYTFLDRPYPYC